ncbi:hypothetical protein B0T17DRAFT_504822 [Bombardia bombarda]|uniref:Uncharacterized protein n=1 Tax=Bombardia bombarda TaxID=252184 RepID=A0AA40C8H8_9PEZI|nr:hypothetical protein B0T17DRAFT_504822 [Bombardia bombarda]
MDFKPQREIACAGALLNPISQVKKRGSRAESMGREKGEVKKSLREQTEVWGSKAGQHTDYWFHRRTDAGFYGWKLGKVLRYAFYGSARRPIIWADRLTLTPGSHACGGWCSESLGIAVVAEVIRPTTDRFARSGWGQGRINTKGVGIQEAANVESMKAILAGTSLPPYWSGHGWSSCVAGGLNEIDVASGKPESASWRQGLSAERTRRADSRGSEDRSAEGGAKGDEGVAGQASVCKPVMGSILRRGLIQRERRGRGWSADASSSKCVRQEPVTPRGWRLGVGGDPERSTQVLDGVRRQPTSGGLVGSSTSGLDIAAGFQLSLGTGEPGLDTFTSAMRTDSLRTATTSPCTTSSCESELGQTGKLRAYYEALGDCSTSMETPQRRVDDDDSPCPLQEWVSYSDNGPRDETENRQDGHPEPDQATTFSIYQDDEDFGNDQENHPPVLDELRGTRCTLTTSSGGNWRAELSFTPDVQTGLIKIVLDMRYFGGTRRQTTQSHRHTPHRISRRRDQQPQRHGVRAGLYRQEVQGRER